MRRVLHWVWSPIRKLRRTHRRDHKTQPRLMVDLAIEKILAEEAARKAEQSSARADVAKVLAQHTMESVQWLDDYRRALHRNDHPELNKVLLDVERNAVRRVSQVMARTARDMSDICALNPEPGRIDGGQP